MINIKKKVSPNFSERSLRYKPDIIVTHITEGKYNGAVSWLCNPDSNASANFVVGRAGEVTELVPITKAAWCNGTSSKSHLKYYYKRSTSDIILKRGGNANDYTISIELEGFTGQTDGELTELQFNALIELIQHIKAQVKEIYHIDIPYDREHLIGHYEVAPKEKPNCPGKYFPFEKILKTLNGDTVIDTTYPVEETKPPIQDTINTEDPLYAKGRKLILRNVRIYPSSNSMNGTIKNGTYYIYDGEIINGRVRITNSVDKVGKSPAGSNVSGYVDRSSIPVINIDTDDVDIIVDVEKEDLYKKGRKVKFENVSLYGSSSSTKTSKRINGLFFIYDGEIVDGKIRITNSQGRVGAEPMASNVTGYVKVSDIR